MVALFANSGDPDQMPHSATSDLGLHYLPDTLFLGVSRLQWVKYKVLTFFMVFHHENIHCGYALELLQ